MYGEFAFPILEEVFNYIAPNDNDTRYQHSDSAMAHILPLLGKLKLNGVNFGPTVTIEQIRTYLPHARIDGQLSPLTFMSNNHQDIVNEVRRDCEYAKKLGRGVNIRTAGSINNGSLLTSMQAAMWAVSEYGQY